MFGLCRSHVTFQWWKMDQPGLLNKNFKKNFTVTQKQESLKTFCIFYPWIEISKNFSYSLQTVILAQPPGLTKSFLYLPKRTGFSNEKKFYACLKEVITWHNKKKKTKKIFIFVLKRKFLKTFWFFYLKAEVSKK